MIKSIFSFVFKLLALIVILLPINYFVLEALLKIPFSALHYFIFVYFILVVFFTQIYMNKSLEKRPQVFVWSFMGVIGLKMFLSLLLLVIIMYSGVNDSKSFGVNFISLYLVFSTFSVLQILRAQRASMNKENNEDKITPN